MKTEIESVSDVKKIIHFEIPWDEVDKHIKQTVRQISRSARIPGFRPGKAPENIIRSRYAEHIKDDVIQHLVPEAYREALAENHFDLVSEPTLHDVMYSEGSPFIFKVTIETRPNIEVQNYEKLSLKAETVRVTDDDVEQVLKRYQERAAELIPLEGKAAEAGDFVHAKVKATVDRAGKKQTLFEDRTLIALGTEENHPSFNENLPGKKAGETVEFDAPYAEDHPEKALAGNTIHYTVTVENVNERRIAPIDDEFAKDLGAFQSLQELKDKVRQDLEKAKTSEQRGRLKDDILKQIIDSHPFEAPEGLIKRETELLLRSYAHSLQRRGIDLNSKEIDWKELQSRLSHQADQNVRGAILIEAIAQKEKIEVTDEDIDRAMSEIADQQRRAPEAVKAEIIKEDKMDDLKHRLLMTKTLDFLLDRAEIEYTG